MSWEGARRGGRGGHGGIWRRRNKEASSLTEVGHVIMRVEEEVLRGCYSREDLRGLSVARFQRRKN